MSQKIDQKDTLDENNGEAILNRCNSEVIDRRVFGPRVDLMNNHEVGAFGLNEGMDVEKKAKF